jgi:hypothetical protein
VGWLDRDLPGWSRRDLEASLELVRSLECDWDFHPEMVSHTFAIDTKTGRPYADRTEGFLENTGFSRGKSPEQLAEYMAYALRILKNVGVRCEGITTPGGFGNRVRPALSQGTLWACRDVFQVEIPHYFRHVFVDDRSVAPRVEYASGLEGPDPKCAVSIIACTGDWSSSWDGLETPEPDKYIAPDLKGGRMPEVIARGEPAIMLCHWPGMYSNGTEAGFTAFKEVVRRLHERHDNLLWMKLSEISRYWAAKELTRIERDGTGIAFKAPFACPAFTVQLAVGPEAAPKAATPLREVGRPLRLETGTWLRVAGGVIVCFGLPKGASRLDLA